MPPMARAIGTRTVSFGLVSIPVKIYSTTAPGESISFRMLHKDCNSRMKQQYVCLKDGETVSRKDMVKGYEFAKDQYLVFEDAEIKAVAQETDSAIAITEFVPQSTVDAVLYEKAYYLGPDKGAERAYRLLSDSLRQTGLTAVAQYRARGKEYLVIIRPIQTGLVMQQLRYAHEIRSFDEVPYEDPGEVHETEMNLALQLIGASSSETFEPEKYKDHVFEALSAVIEQKLEGQEVSLAPSEAPKTQVIDLMAALKASLATANATPEETPSEDDKAAEG